MEENTMNNIQEEKTMEPKKNNTVRNIIIGVLAGIVLLFAACGGCSSSSSSSSGGDSLYSRYEEAFDYWHNIAIHGGDSIWMDYTDNNNKVYIDVYDATEDDGIECVCMSVDTGIYDLRYYFYEDNYAYMNGMTYDNVQNFTTFDDDNVVFRSDANVTSWIMVTDAFFLADNWTYHSGDDAVVERLGHMYTQVDPSWF